jgi:hypothetical protein
LRVEGKGASITRGEEANSPAPAAGQGPPTPLPNGSARPHGPEAARALVGRPGELETLWSFLADAVTSAGSLLISGEPGVGKTALLGAAVARAEVLGYQVVRAGGAEFEANVSFATLNQILGPFLGMMPQLEPEHWEALGAVISLGGGHVTDPPRVATATLALLRKAAANRPLLLVVDDLPWLDKASARVLAFVGRRVTGSPIAFLGAARTGEGGFFEEGDFPRLMVPPLQDAAADALLQRSFPALPGRVR